MSAGTPSFERLNYLLRTNKNIERKLVFEKLQELSLQFSFQHYRYVGLGSMWFVDFMLAHRMLRISDMWSFEDEAPTRAEFNRPYKCIEVRPGSSRKLIAEMTAADWTKPTIAWLDYDDRFDTDVKKDVDEILSKGAVGSVAIVSVNAQYGSYRPKLKDCVTGTSIDTLRALLGDSVPVDPIPGTRQDLSKQEFPPVLSLSILSFMSAAVRISGRASNGTPDSFVPLFNLFHQDGAEMVTVGGIVVSAEQLARLAASQQRSEADLVAGAMILKDDLDLIPITAREKLGLDRLLPCDEAQFEEAVAASGLKLNVAEATKYRRFYPHFPVFVEMFG